MLFTVDTMDRMADRAAIAGNRSTAMADSDGLEALGSSIIAAVRNDQIDEYDLAGLLYDFRNAVLRRERSAIPASPETRLHQMERVRDGVSRTRVPGGWLYESSETMESENGISVALSTTFVPDPWS